MAIPKEAGRAYKRRRLTRLHGKTYDSQSPMYDHTLALLHNGEVSLDLMVSLRVVRERHGGREHEQDGARLGQQLEGDDEAIT
jgi:hypothetical protein